MFGYYGRMTEAQQAAVDRFKAELKDEISFCVERLQKIEAIGPHGGVPLPATAASGEPVLHGANVNMYHLKDYYLERLRLLRNVLPVDTYRAMIPRDYQ